MVLLSFFLSPVYNCSHGHLYIELFHFPTIYEPKLKDDCENWIIRSMETENMVELKRALAFDGTLRTQDTTFA